VFNLRDSRKYSYIIIIFLIVASCIAFSPIAENHFINLDDNEYILENHPLQSGFNSQSIQWAFTSVVKGNWHPLTLLSHMLDWSLFGANASGHHLVSLFFHIGAIVFLFLFLNKTTNTIWPAAFAAAFFALHPLRVESVAWASERKDVLSMFFGIACLYAYVFYAEAPKISRYLACLILFVMSLMSKPMMVTLPFVLMLLDYWPLQRWQKTMDAPVKNGFHAAGKLLWEKVPFICLTLASCIVTLWAQHKDNLVVSLDSLPFTQRLSNAIVSCAVYLEKTIWPFNLAVFYPFEYFLPLWKVIFSGIILIIITLTVLYYIKKLPFLFVGWFWYLGTLVPVIGLVQVANQAMADRYTYLPSIGIAMMLAWGIPLLFQRKNTKKRLFPLAGIAVIIFLAVLTWRQCGYWKNSSTLFSHSLRVTENNHLAHNNLGITLIQEGRIREAIYHYDKAISIVPDIYFYYINRGIAYTRIGEYQLALNDYNKVISLTPNTPDAYYFRGSFYGKNGQSRLAINDFNKAIELNPDYIQAYNNRGNAYADMGQYQQAIENFNEAIRRNPDYADAYNNRAFVYLNQGDIISGCRDAQKACELGNCKMLKAAKSKESCLK
jgi:protein O-mannosyl-transferase